MILNPAKLDITIIAVIFRQYSILLILIILYKFKDQAFYASEIETHKNTFYSATIFLCCLQQS
jgi:hypothetical protein